MKITDVKGYVVVPDMPDSHRGLWESLFVQVDTDEGITGFGEATNWPHGGSFLIGRALDLARDALVGEDPADIERLWHKLYRRHTYLGSRGLPTALISGVDIALWDIKGKALGRPIWDLLGGKFRDRVLLYANGWMTDCHTPEEFAHAAREVMLPAGHTACKLDPFQEMSQYFFGFVNGQISAEGEEAGYDIVAAVREAVGPRHEILIDAHGNFNVPTAIRLANNLFEQSRIGWFEEPLPPESFAALKQVRENTDAPICVGERLFTRFDFLPVFQDRLADYIMPDVVWTGGISEMKKIATMAEAYYIPISPHNACGPLQIVAGAQVMMSVPNFYRLEYAMSFVPAYNAFLTEPMVFTDGYLEVSSRPGLGHDLDLDYVRGHLHPDWTR